MNNIKKIKNIMVVKLNKYNNKNDKAIKPYDLKNFCIENFLKLTQAFCLIILVIQIHKSYSTSLCTGEPPGRWYNK